MKTRKIIPVAVLLFIIITGLYVYFTMPIRIRELCVPEIPEQLSMNKTLTMEQISADRDAVIESVENIHPYFLVAEKIDKYQQAKDEYVKNTSAEMTVGDFAMETGKFLGFFEDGHTMIVWNETAYLSIPWEFYDGRLYLKEDGVRSDIYAVSIGGQQVTHILEQVEKICPVENEMTKPTRFADYASGRNLLLNAGVELTNGKILVTFSDGKERRFSFSIPRRAAAEAEKTVTNTYLLEDNVFIVDFNACIDDEELHTIAEELKKSIENGISKVILDVRGNGGGNSAACERLLNSMGMKAPEYSTVIRFSEEAARQNGYIRKDGSIEMKGKFEGKTNPKVDLVVLCDEHTYSSATMLLVWVRDGGLGTIIGEPSAGVPSHYGDIIYYVLENSKLYGGISHKKFTRPDETNQESVLQPDIVTASDEAMKTAMEYLKKLE